MADTENRALNDKFMLRLPDGMRDRIKEAAEANNRSMNAEIVARLEGSFSSSNPELLVTIDEKIGALLEHLGWGSVEEKRQDAPKPKPKHKVGE